MRVLIDADGCPVTRAAVQIAERFRVEAFVFCDTSHDIQIPGAETIMVSKGADSADFALLRMIKPGDAVVTQDYGLAALCLARGAAVVSQDGLRYTADNIDALLLSRHTSRKIRESGGRMKGPKKRPASQDAAFCAAFEALICELKPLEQK